MAKSESERVIITLSGFTAGRIRQLSKAMGDEAIAKLVSRGVDEWVISDSYERLLEAADKLPAPQKDEQE